MLRKHTFFLKLIGCFALFYFVCTDFIFASGLDKYLEGDPLVVGSVKFIPVTLRDGMESQKSPLWPLNNPAKIFEEPIFDVNEKRAVKVGIDLKEELDRYSVAGYKNNSFFFLFYNFFTASGCSNDYIIQRTKLDKLYYDFSGTPYKRQEQFFVEAFALNQKKETLRAVEHQKEYRLGEFLKRKVIIDFETGCGEIPEVVTGAAWPNPDNKLYYKIQGYTNEPELYDKVEFEFSSQYRITMEFDRDGNYSLDLPF